MVKGRVSINYESTGSVNVVAEDVEKDDIIFKVTSINSIPLTFGTTVHLEQTSSEGTGYKYYEIDSNDTPLRVFSLYNEADVTRTIQDPSAVGIACIKFFADVASDFNITYTMSVLMRTLVGNPISILKYVLKCQNWKNVEVSESEIGKEDENALINESESEGGFNNPLLSEISQHTIARQILSKPEASTDVISKSICEDCFIINFQNNIGHESVSDVLTKQSPIETIIYTDTKKIGDIQENQEVYSDITINFAYDQLTQSFKSKVEIKNTNFETYDPSYVTGISDPSIAEELWNKYKESWNSTNLVSEVPKKITDKVWFISESVTVWYLRRLYLMMKTSKISIVVNYMKARKYHIGQHVMLNLPFTSGVALECVVENFSKDLDSDSVDLDLLILDEIPYYISWQNTFDSDGPQYQDVFDTDVETYQDVMG